MVLRPFSWSLAATLLALRLSAGCADSPAPQDGATSGPHVAIDVAALNLQGVGDVVWDIEVDNGASTPQVVWQRRVSSSGYGDGAGSASYVGTCDADPAVQTNTIKVWVVGVYSAPVTTVGTFASGAAGGVSGVAVPFQNPTTAGAPLTRSVVCAANTDVAVQFDVALMRPAQQGFFDIAVSFNNVFCSAKFDCCDDTNQNGTCEAGEDIDLLYTADAGRGRTMVLGFACTGGVAATDDTTLYMDPLSFDCTSPPTGFTADFTVSPAAAAAGNQCTAGNLAGCAAVTDPAPAEADTYLYQVAVYRGQEQLTTGGAAAHKAYWNVALGVTNQIGSCWLRTRATAASTGATSTGFSGGVVAAGAVYPYVLWDVELAACAAEPLSFDGTGMVEPAYTATTDIAATAFGYAFAPGLPPSPVCATPCQNGGTCTDPDTCTCLAGYTGASCETPDGIVGDDTSGRTFFDGSYAVSCLAYLNDSRYTGATGDGFYWIDPSGGAPIEVWCDMTTESGGWVDVVKTFHRAGADVAALTTLFWSGDGNITGTAATSAAGDGVVLVSDQNDPYDPAYYLIAPMTYSSVRLAYRMQGSEDGTRCSSNNWVPLNGPGWSGGNTNYLAACPAGYACIQGSATVSRDQPIAVSGYAIDGLDPATTLLTWSGWTYGTFSSSGCTRDADIPSDQAALYVTRLLMR